MPVDASAASARDSSTPTLAAPDSRDISTRPAAPSSAAEHSAEYVMYSAATAAEGLRLAQARFGADSFAVNRAMQVVRSLCSRSVDPSGSLNHGSPDPTRDWVIEKIVAYCADWTPEAFKATASPDAPTNVHQVLREQGEAAALDVAQGQIASSDDSATLHEAALLLLERDRIPGSGATNVGPADAAVSIGHAARLVACDTSDSCGPYSPITLAYCRIGGCTPGVHLIDALRENLPPGDFALVLWYYQWMNSQRTRAR